MSLICYVICVLFVFDVYFTAYTFDMAIYVIQWNVCKKSFQSHSKVIDCCICESKFHIKCISLNAEDQAEMSNNPSCWYCRSCLCEIFPYNHIKDDKSFVVVIDNFRFSDRLAELSDMLFQPFELNTENYYSPLFDIDPDINFYNKIDLHINSSCKYYMEEEFSMVLRNLYNICPTENRLSLCHINIRSLQANLHSFEKYLENIDIKFSCVAVAETWLQDHNCALYNLNGYELIENHRQTRRVGGMGIYLKEDIPFLIRSDIVLPDGIIESVFIEIHKHVYNKETNVVIGVIYRSANSDINQFNDWVSEILTMIKVEKKICYLMGDYNINLMNYENNILTSDFVDLLHSHAFISLINRPSRITSTTAILIDNIFTNSTNIENSFQGLLVTDVSDHLPIFCVDFEKTDCAKEDFIYRRNMSQRNKLAFKDDLANLDWNEMYQLSDTQAAFGWFHS